MNLPTAAGLCVLPRIGSGAAQRANRAHTAVGPSAVRFRKSSYSFRENCVEVANEPGPGVAVRDSAHTAAAPLSFAGPAWTALLGLVKTGRL